MSSLSTKKPARSGWLRGRAVLLGAAAALGFVRAGPVSAQAQAPAAQGIYATPEAGWSKRRGLAVGARVGRPLVGGLDVVAQGLVFFPDERRVADPGVDVNRSLWHTSLNLLYLFDRTRGLAPYVGLGVRYGRASLTIVVDGLRAHDVGDAISPNFVGGARLTRLPGRPFVEYRSGGSGGWVLTGGASLPLS